MTAIDVAVPLARTSRRAVGIATETESPIALAGGATGIIFGTATQYPATNASPGSSITQGGSVTVPVGADDLLVLVYYGNTLNTPNQVAGVTLGSSPLTKVGSAFSPAGSTGRGVDLWRLASPPSGTFTLTATYAASQFGEVIAVPVFSSTGVVSLSALVTDQGTGTSSSLLGTSGKTSWLAGFIARVSTTLTVSDNNLVAPGATNATMSVGAAWGDDNAFSASWATAGEYAGLVVGLSPGTAGTSPAMPTGDVFTNGRHWVSDFSEDFLVDAAVGTWTNTSSGVSTLTSPAGYKDRWNAYPISYPDTSHRGYYDPARCLSVSGGWLDINMDYNAAATNPFSGATGAYAVAALLPKTVSPLNGGRVEALVKVPHGSHTFKTAWLFFPDDNLWPDHGEIDFMEGFTDGFFEAYAHYAQAAGIEPHQDGFVTSVTMNDGGEHRVAVEWVSGQSIRFYLDGSLILVSTFRVPNTPMHVVLQNETNIGSAVSTTDTAHIQVGWVRTWTDGGVTGRVVAVNPVVEPDTAPPMIHRKTRALTPGAETETPRPITRTGARTIVVNPAIETDLPVALSASGPAPTSDHALPVRRSSVRALGTVSETDAPIRFLRSGAYRILVSPAIEADSPVTIAGRTANSGSEHAIPIGHKRRKTIAPAVERDEGVHILDPHARFFTVGTATETDLAVHVPDPNALLCLDPHTVGGFEDHSRGRGRHRHFPGLWAHFGLPRTEYGLYLWRDGTVRVVDSYDDYAAYQSADAILGGGHNITFKSSSWEAAVLRAAGYTLVEASDGTLT